MSVGLYAMTAEPSAEKREPCLCAQMAEGFGDFVMGVRSDWETLRSDANPSCQTCGGSGVEEVRVNLQPQTNFANGNAKIVLGAMGMDAEDLYGECDLATMKRGIIRARNINHPEILREREEHGNFIGHGYTRDQLMRAIDELEEVVRVAERDGATRITWG